MEQNWPKAMAERLRYGLLVIVSSITCGYASFYVYYVSRVTKGFSGKTDIIGYPSFFNYDNYAFFYGYLLGLLVAVGTLLILSRYADLQQFDNFLRRLPAIALTSVVVALALVLKSSGTWYGWATINVVLLTLFEIGAFRIDLRRARSGESAYAECVLSIALAATVPLLLFYISQNTGWRSGPGIIAHARWFPLPVLIATEIAVLVVGFMHLRRHSDRRFFDRYLVRLILIPVLIYLLVASLPSTSVVDDFHGGEKLAPLSLGLRGAVPWRDFLFIHGVWDDFLQLYIPARLWEPTPRAGLAGTALLFAPLYWISFYLLFLAVFEFALLPALLAFFIVIALFLPNAAYVENLFGFRFFLYPLILICLYQAVRSKRAVLWIVLTALCGIQVLIAPEFALLALCLGFVIILRDLLSSDRQEPWIRGFRPTLVSGITTAVFVTLSAWLLSSFGALDGFLLMAVQIARGHLETGGIPVQPIDALLWVAGIPLFFIIGSTFVFVRALRSSRSQIPAIVWLLWAIALCTAIYYPKYIGRPDNHIAEVFVVAQPGIALLIVFLLAQAKDLLRDRYRPSVLTAAGVFLLGLVLLYRIPGDPFAPPPLFGYMLDSAESLRSRFISANQTTKFADLSTNGTAAAKAAALRRFFDAHLRPEDTVYDFSDSPTTFFAILQLKPASRFIHVSMAIQEELQREVTKDLEKNRPPYVVYHSDSGLNGWDGIPNEVRHYVVARYINLNYVYDRTIEGSLIFRRADLPGEAQNDGGATTLSACELGYTPNVFAPRTAPHERQSATVSQSATNSYLQLNGWVAAPEGDSRPELFVSWNGAVLDHFQPTAVRPEIDKALGRALGPTGFSRRILLPNAEIAPKDIEITVGKTSTGRLVHLRDGPFRGQLDSSTITPMYNVSLPVPRSERPAYLGLQFADSSMAGPQQFEITSPSSGGARIDFMKIARDHELMLPLGGCYAWGAISKSGPQIGSAKPFTLQSASYYYE